MASRNDFKSIGFTNFRRGGYCFPKQQFTRPKYKIVVEENTQRRMEGLESDTKETGRNSASPRLELSTSQKQVNGRQVN